MPRRRLPLRAIALAVWAVAVALVIVVAAREGGGVGSVLAGVLRSVGRTPAGLLALLAIYLVRPVLLLPVTVLTAFCGYLFGPWLGLLVAHGGGVVSATVAYLAARVWRGRPPAVPAPWLERLRSRSFETLLVSRLTFVPGDLVNAVSGALGLPLRAFLAATVLGGLPGTVVATLAGAGMHGSFEAGGVRVRPGFVVASLALAGMSALLARSLRRRVGTPLPLSGAAREPSARGERADGSEGPAGSGGSAAGGPGPAGP